MATQVTVLAGIRSLAWELPCAAEVAKKKKFSKSFFLIRNKCWILSNASASVKMMVCFKFFLNYTVNQVDWSSDVSPGATSTWS